MYGRRFGILKLEEMTTDQRAVAERAMSGPLKQINPSLNAWLRSPAVADAVQRLGSHIFGDKLIPLRLKELVVLIVARHWTAQYPWTLHYSIALKEGVKKADIEMIAVGKRPLGLNAEETAIYDFAKCLLDGVSVSDSTYDGIVAAYGESGIVDVIALIGYYGMVCMIKNVDDVPAVEGAPLLQPLP